MFQSLEEALDEEKELVQLLPQPARMTRLRMSPREREMRMFMP